MSLGTCRCGARWTGLSKAHCPTCHRLFSTVGNFDAHRVAGECVDPATKGLLESDGLWHRPGVIPSPHPESAAIFRPRKQQRPSPADAETGILEDGAA